MVNTGEFSDIFTVTRSLTPAERSIIQGQVEKGYETFLDRVSEGRDMRIEEVEKVAGGRVWTGEQALTKGLVDVLGSYEEAVKMAAEKANVADDYRVSFYPRKLPWIEELMGRLSDESEARIFGVNDMFKPLVKNIELLQKMNGIQVLLPGNLQVY